MIPLWFLYVGGISLFLLGALQIQQRPRQRGDGFYQRFVNVGTLWSLCCIGVGLWLVLMALGWVEVPGARPPPSPPSLRSRVR
jgi:hypothetical protein